MSGARLAIGADGGGGSTGRLALVLVLGAVVVSAWVVWIVGVVGTIWLASFDSVVVAGGAGTDGLAEGAIPEELLCCSNLMIRSSSFWRRSDTSFLSSQELLN